MLFTGTGKSPVEMARRTLAGWLDEIDTVRYGFELLRAQPTRGCMLVTQGIGEATAQGRRPAGNDLRTIEPVDDVTPGLQVLAGLFARRNERAAYPMTLR